MKFNFHNKIYFSVAIFALLMFFTLSAFPIMARAEADIADQSADWFSAGNSGEVGLPDQADKAASAAVAKCQSIVAKPCASPTDCGQAQLAATQAQMACIDEAQKNNADLTNRSQWKEYAKKVSDDLKKETRSGSRLCL